MMKNTMLEMTRYAALARQAVAEGVVLLKNEAVLPLAPGGRAALFGYAQFHYYKSGTGSGGLVNVTHVPNLPEILGGDGGYRLDAEGQARYAAWLADHPYEMGTGWAQEPWFQPEMPLDEEFVRAAAQRADTAFIVIGRTAGEDQDNTNTPGSFLLTEDEENMLALVCRYFNKSVVLLNVGNIIDMQWVARYAPGAVAYIWQGGQEGCRGVLDVLNGTVSPSGKLPDTIARTPADYPAAGYYGADDRNFYAEDIYVGYRYFETFAPEKVLYPFGFGLSYTKFEVKLLSADENADGITAVATVKNIGARPGKEVVQLYCTAPQGLLGKPAKVLCAFAKTKTLAPGESQTLMLTAPWRNFASYDDSGATGHKSAFVLEAGDYIFSLGTDVRHAAETFTVTLPLMVVEQQESAAAPAAAFERLRPGADGSPAWESVPTEAELPETRCVVRLPKERPQTGDKGIRLQDVADGKVDMADFVAQFSDDELCTIVRGEGMNSPRVTPGTAGAIGGVSDALQHYGLPAACCSDGPSGIRMDCGTVAFAMPNGTCLAATFNEDLSEELYSMEGLELRKNHVDTLLGPGINIHRHPLNGRNFEYFSEDPFISGMMGAFGAALIARDRASGSDTPSSTLPIQDILGLQWQTRTARCQGCTNHCMLTVSLFPGGRRHITGNRCEKGLGKTAAGEKGPNVMAYKLKRMFDYQPLTAEQATRGELGIPRVLNMYENFPFWMTLLTKLGFRVVLSPASSRAIYEKGMESIPSESECYPAKMAHGHVQWLIDQGVGTIFYPSVFYERQEDMKTQNHFNCPMVVANPENIANNVEDVTEGRVRMLKPFLALTSEKTAADALVLPL